MSKRFIDGTDFMKMIFSGAQILQSEVDTVNSLNVFPVPDGDTGTNMNMTVTSGIQMLKSKPETDIGAAAEIFAKGLLMGARGNSGVILSQLFRGFAKSVSGLKELNAVQFAAALQQGVDTAYQAVVKPVEGTILTVSREAAQHGGMISRRSSNIVELMKEVLDKAKETLLKTPDLLPILKQAGVVDSGGQGLVFIYEGFYKVLEQETKGIAYEVPDVDALANKSSPLPNAQAAIQTEDIEFPYDMEFLIHLHTEQDKESIFDLKAFQKFLENDGDSILVIPDSEIVKVHVHTRKPGDVLNLATHFGELSQFHIENMRDRHRMITEAVKDTEPAKEKIPSASSPKTKPYGVVAVAVGSGISDIFTSIGVDYVLSGGQTMNPSTEDIVEAIRQVHAEKVFILPNNSNIILAAQQAKDLVENEVVVIPSITIPQGIAAMFAFQQSASMDANAKAMTQAIKEVKSGQVTYAVRDSTFDGIDIQEGDFLGILGSKIITAENDILNVSKKLLEEMVTDEDGIITIFKGKDASEEETKHIISFLEEAYPHMDIESHQGGQPLYYYIFSVE